MDLFNGSMTVVACALFAVFDLSRRYRSSLPVVLETPTAQVYILLHAIAAALIFWVMSSGEAFGLSGSVDISQAILLTVIATLGLLHISFFSVMHEGKSVEIGPAFLSSTLIEMTDRALAALAVTDRAGDLLHRLQILRGEVSEDPEINSRALDIRDNESLRDLLDRIVDLNHADLLKSDDETIADPEEDYGFLQGLSRLQSYGLVEIKEQRVEDVLVGLSAIPTRLGILVSAALLGRPSNSETHHGSLA